MATKVIRCVKQALLKNEEVKRVLERAKQATEESGRDHVLYQDEPGSVAYTTITRYGCGLYPSQTKENVIAIIYYR